MIFPVHADIIGLIEGIYTSLKPFAQAHEVELNFKTETRKLITLHSPELVSPDLTHLLCRVITFTPQQQEVEVRIHKLKPSDIELVITIENSGVNLSLLGDIQSGLKSEVKATGKDKGSIFQMNIPLHNQVSIEPTSIVSGNSRTIIKPWYSEIRKRLTSHFSDPDQLAKAARHQGIHAGVFLGKINAIIYSQIDKEGFNAEDLAKLVALSRTQLFRKVKNLTNMAPGQYIRTIRLKKAKELLEKGDLNVSEVAYSVGFLSNSHFTRAFQQHFGINPSALK